MPPAVGSESDPADRMDIPFDQIVAGTWDHTAVTDEQRTKSDECVPSAMHTHIYIDTCVHLSIHLFAAAGDRKGAQWSLCCTVAS